MFFFIVTSLNYSIFFTNMFVLKKYIFLYVINKLLNSNYITMKYAIVLFSIVHNQWNSVFDLSNYIFVFIFIFRGQSLKVASALSDFSCKIYSFESNNKSIQVLNDHENKIVDIKFVYIEKSQFLKNFKEWVFF